MSLGSLELGEHLRYLAVATAEVLALKIDPVKLRVRNEPERDERHGTGNLDFDDAEPLEASQRFSRHAFGALFAEVAVDPELGETRVRRIVGAYGASRIAKPRLARSQCIGGMIGGIGMALMEHSVVDARNGRIPNANLAEYAVPVHADCPQVMDVHFVEEHDPYVNPLGAKGIGEIALVGVAPAIANAIFHTTGKRIRTLPVAPDKLI